MGGVRPSPPKQGLDHQILCVGEGARILRVLYHILLSFLCVCVWGILHGNFNDSRSFLGVDQLAFGETTGTRVHAIEKEQTTCAYSFLLHGCQDRVVPRLD